MKKVIGYIKSSFYNIRKNKMYSTFYIAGTALTFVFIILILQFISLITTETTPNLNASRIIIIDDFKNTQGWNIGGISPVEINQFMQIVEPEKYSYIGTEVISFSTNDQIKDAVAFFVGGDYFDMYQFDLINGHAFTREDVENKNKVVVITEDVAKDCFPKGKALGENITIQGGIYKIVGVVANYPLFAFTDGGASVWIPSCFDKFIPSNRPWFRIHIQFPNNMDENQMKRKLVNSVSAFYENKNQEVDINEDDIYTQQESKMKDYFSRYILYGIGGAFILLLLIPALNIVVLSRAQSESREEEMAIKKAIGATRLSVFWQLLSENFILVIIGIIIGGILAIPIADLIQSFVLGDIMGSQMSLISGFDFSVLILQVFPLALLFVFLSGGIPAFLVSRKNISLSLRGGNEI